MDTSCAGSFTRNKEDCKWALLDRIQDNTEGWENDKGRKSGITYDFECIKTFMNSDEFRNVSTAYGLDSQVVVTFIKPLLPTLVCLRTVLRVLKIIRIENDKL